MVIVKRFISLSVLFFLILLPATSFAEIYNVSSAINKAGRQRMLSQRIVATYGQIGLEIQIRKSKRQLRKAINLFDEQLGELYEFRQSGKINLQLKKVSKAWKPLKEIVEQPVQRSNAEEVRTLAEDVLTASHRVVIMLQDEAKSAKGRLVNISGRQRMLSQRLASLYTLQSWGFASSEYSDDFSRAMNEFKGALGELKASELNTEEINRNLIKAKREFSMLERGSRHENGEYIPLMVKMSADKLLVLMNDTTQMYEALERDN
jgi:nitrate/nitrite-specific signal transduction histidine kinase